MRGMTDAPLPDLPTIKALAAKHRVDFRTLRSFLETGKHPRGALVRVACVNAATEWRRKVASKAVGALAEERS